MLLEKGSEHPMIQTLSKVNMPLERDMEMSPAEPIDLMQLLPENRAYWTYMGSMATPFFTEGVLWMVMKQPLAVFGGAGRHLLAPLPQQRAARAALEWAADRESWTDPARRDARHRIETGGATSRRACKSWLNILVNQKSIVAGFFGCQVSARALLGGGLISAYGFSAHRAQCLQSRG
ncbi:MAG: carbonic anhydrase family protein [Sulfuritalea sp.]|nr:carbonic anhydrase family protein [Sulfuritalea sp.]